MGYFRKRISQPSTWLGLIAAGMALAASKGQITPEVTASLLSAAGLIQIDESKQ